jgi:hypothetical protein
MPPTLTCDSSRVTQAWTMLLQRPRDSLEMPRLAASPEPPAQ